MQADTFRLIINLGADAMSEPEHVAHALASIAYNVASGADSGPIRDQNGNTCGRWEFTTEAARLTARDPLPDLEVLAGPDDTTGPDGWRHRAYRVRLTYQGRTIETPYRIGMAGGPVEAHDVARCLLMDAGWVESGGADDDPRYAEHAATAQRIRAFFGPMYRALNDDPDRYDDWSYGSAERFAAAWQAAAESIRREPKKHARHALDDAQEEHDAARQAARDAEHAAQEARDRYHAAILALDNAEAAYDRYRENDDPGEAA